MKLSKTLIVMIIIVVSLILLGVYQSQKETITKFTLTGELIGLKPFQEINVNDGTVHSFGYFLTILNATHENGYRTTNTEYWFSSLGSYEPSFIEGLFNQTIKIDYHSNKKDKVEIDLIYLYT